MVRLASEKTTFAANAPGVLFMGNEEGTYNLDVARLPKAKSYEDITGAISELKATKHNYIQQKRPQVGT